MFTGLKKSFLQSLEGKITKITERKITDGKKDLITTETEEITTEKIEEIIMKIGRNTSETVQTRETRTITGGMIQAGKDLLSGMIIR